MKHAIDLSLYLVLDPTLCAPLGLIETTRLAVKGGVTTVQLRHKQASTQQLIEIGRALQHVLAGTETTLVINDDCEAAKALNADAVHLGQGDLSVVEARRIIGADMLLGVSVGTVEQASRVDGSRVDYMGVGAVFATQTKTDHPPVLGFDGLSAIVEAASVPVVAIGGLKYQHITHVFATGAKGMAVVSALCGQDDVLSVTHRFRSKIDRVRG